MADGEQLMNFNDGEGMVHTDFTDMQWLLRSHLVQMQPWGIGAAVGLTSADAGDFLGEGNYLNTPGSNNGVWAPNVAGLFDRADLLNKLVTNKAGRLLKYRTNADGGNGVKGRWQMFAFDDEDLASSLALSAGLPAANPRWDTLELDFADAAGTSTARDFEDAATRALTSPAVNKRLLVSAANVAWKLGAEAALPDFPALSDSTKGRILSVKRATAEGGTVLRDVYALHVYPLRLGFEDVMAVEANFDDSIWARASAGGLAHTAGGTSGNLSFQPRTMHAGCRLLAIGVCWNVANEPAVSLGRYAYGVGSPVHTSIADVGSGGTIPSGGGIYYCGESEWTTNAAIAAGTNARYPIWGNGTTYGPLFNDRAVAAEETKLNVLLSGAADAWGAGDLVNFVRFIYAY